MVFSKYLYPLTVKKLLIMLKNLKQRPLFKTKKLSRDNSPEIDAWRHAIKFLYQKLKLKPNYIISVPTTCPLRKVSDLNLCLKTALKKNLDIVFTAVKSSRNPYFNMISKRKKRLI